MLIANGSLRFLWERQATHNHPEQRNAYKESEIEILIVETRDGKLKCLEADNCRLWDGQICKSEDLLHFAISL